MKPKTRIKNRGFSILELLVAIFVGALVVTAVYSLFVMQNHSYINQNVVSEMQQNVRMAINILSAEFRMAGFGFSINGDYKTTSTTTVFAVTPVNSTSGPDRVTLQYGINSTSLTGAMANSTGGSMSVSSTGVLQLNLPNNDNRIIISDGQNACRLQVTSINSGTSLSFTPVSPNSFPTGGFALGSRVYKLKEMRYQISNNTLQSSSDSGVTWQDVAYNIEDLQLAYHGNDTPLGTWLNNPSPVDRTTITDVQINILGRGGVADLQFTGYRPLLRDHPAGSPDHFRRRPLTSTVRMRNL